MIAVYPAETNRSIQVIEVMGVSGIREAERGERMANQKCSLAEAARNLFGRAAHALCGLSVSVLLLVFVCIYVPFYFVRRQIKRRKNGEGLAEGEALCRQKE